MPPSAVITGTTGPARERETGTNLATALTLLLILALAAVLRVVGVRYGLPAVYNPDEVAIMSRALAFATGDPNPHNFLYPTFYFYALFGWIGMFFVGARLAGTVSSIADFQRTFFVDPTNIYLAGRVLTVVAGVATVAAVYALGRRLWDRTAAIPAALFLAVAPIHVRDSHYVKHDVPATLAIVVAYLAFVALMRSGSDSRSSRGRIIAAGAACGLAFATHYYSIFLIVPLAMAAAWGADSVATAARRLVLAGSCAAIVFFVLSPFVLLEPATAWRDITANREIVVDRALESGGRSIPNFSVYTTMLLRDAAGWPVALLAAAGGVHLLINSSRLALLLLAFPVTFFLFITNTVPATRYLNPMLPALVLLGGYAVSVVAARGGRWSAREAGIIAIVAALPGAVASLQTGLFFRQTDTRTLAQQFIEETVPPGSSILVQPQSVQLTQSRENLIESLRARIGDETRASTKFRLRLALDPYPAPAYRTIFLGDGGLDADKIYVGYGELGKERGLDRFDELGIEYVILKDEPDASVMAVREALEARARLVKRILPYTGSSADVPPEPFLHNTDAKIDAGLERPGPRLEVWKLR